MSKTDTKTLLPGLVRSKKIQSIEVAGWSEPAYALLELATEPIEHAPTLLSPFDSLIWSRPRVARLFDFEYRMEFYVPEAKRQYGYYVMPFLCDGGLAGRVSVKADRRRGKLLVLGVWFEPGAETRQRRKQLDDSLASLESWVM